MRVSDFATVLVVAATAITVAVVAPAAHAQDAEPLKNYRKAEEALWRHIYPLQDWTYQTLYCATPIGKGTGITHSRARTKHGYTIYIQHVFPMSWVTRALGCGSRKRCRKESQVFNRIEADLHNIFPILSAVSDARNGRVYGEVAGENHIMPGCDLETAKGVLEPGPAARGPIARAMLYMAERYKYYGLTLTPQQKKRMHEWNRIYRPSAKELHRNRAIARVQGNGNLFVGR
ncbi:MAG: endonuclease [Gammaproteobacteria bacterium]|nr:endonuclease [Gammaproteobacteria bacterium]